MSADARAGQVVAGFRVVSAIGEGAMGTVYLAESPDSGRVALKVLAPELARDERFRRRFLRETEVAASLEHPNVVRTLAAGEADGTLYLAREYVEGSDLRELLRREGRLQPERALDIAAQVAAGLDAAHNVGLVHRDVKPANILVARTDPERAYVCDLGLARHLSSPSSLTGDRGFVGTIDYVPPEQIEGGTIDGRADVYSLGCVLYECLTGAKAFDRDSELAVVFAHLNEPPPKVSEARPELPRAFDLVVETALAKSPDDRYATCGELVEAARGALEGRTVARRTSRRVRYAIAAVAVLAAIGAAVGGVLATRGGSPEPPAITQTSIAGAPLGLRRAAYERIFGEPGLLSYQQQGGGTGYATLTFADKKVSVFFPNFITGKAGIITTWNKAYRTAAGVGPCSTIDDVKAAYGSALEPDRSATIGKSHFLYDVGKNLLLATPGTSGHPSRFVTAVGLFNGRARGATRDEGPRDLAGFVTGNETPLCRP